MVVIILTATDFKYFIRQCREKQQIAYKLKPITDLSRTEWFEQREIKVVRQDGRTIREASGYGHRPHPPKSYLASQTKFPVGLITNNSIDKTSVKMSLADYKSPGKQSSPSLSSPIVQLNIGGHLFSTKLSTLRKHPSSKLSDMFNGQPKLRTDSEGRYFIDRDGTHFGAILEFLRTDRVPKENILEVHKEAVHYDIKPLVKQLEETPQFFGEAVGRQQFISRVPNYKENIEVLIRVARAEAIAARHSKIIICVLRTEDDAALYGNAINSLDTNKESVVTFGPWKANPTTADLLECIKMDVEAQGYRVCIQPHSTDKGFLSKSYDCFYKLIFTWW